MTIPHRDLRLLANSQERAWLEANDPAPMEWKGWEVHTISGWMPVYGKPRWNEDNEYRHIEPERTVTVYTKDGAVELPEPMREAPEGGSTYHLTGVGTRVWTGLDAEREWLADGELFHTAEHAQAWADFQRMQRLGESNDA